MSMTPPAHHCAARPPAPDGGRRVVNLSELLKRPVTDRNGQPLGRLSDVIVRLRGADYPLVTGLVLAVGRRELFVSIEQVCALDEDALKLTSTRVSLRPFERRDGEVLLRADVLGHRLIDVADACLVRASDLELAPQAGQWLLSCVDARRHRRLARLLGRRSTPRVARDWKAFEPLIGHIPSALLRSPFARVRGLKPAQIADLIEQASQEEGEEILGHVREDPELEADVFEELDEDLQSRLLGARTDAEIAGVLARMRADDAADAIAELPQRRRVPVLDLLPAGQRAKVRTLMGFNETSAGGLMGVEFVAMAADGLVEAALAAIRNANNLQPEALTSVYTVDDEGLLTGVVRLVTLVQADQAERLGSVTDTDPVRVGQDTDVVDVALLMTDYNLITLPVVDDDGHLVGLITVDDVLDATLPEEWRRREPPAPPADTHRGDDPDAVGQDDDPAAPTLGRAAP
jgi:CBS domain-containing protein